MTDAPPAPPAGPAGACDSCEAAIAPADRPRARLVAEYFAPKFRAPPALLCEACAEEAVEYVDPRPVSRFAHR